MAKGRISYFRQYLSFQLGRLKACTVFSIIFSALGFPAFTAAQLLSANTRAYDPLVVSLYVVSVISILGCAAMSFITPVISFQHLFTKVKADNILSLPITSTQRFFGDLSAAYISFHLPFALGTALTCFLEYTLCQANNWRWSQDCAFALAALGIVLMFSALNIAIMTCCGRLTEAIIYPIVINIAMPLLVTFGGYISFENCIGLGTNIEYEILASPLFMMWPAGAVISITYFVYIFIIAPIATLVYLAIAFFGYKLRKAENIGKPFVFRPVYIVFSSLVALALITGYTYLTDFATLKGDSIIPSILILGLLLLVLMLIIEVIHSKKIKKILNLAARYGITLVGGLLLCFGLLLTKGFGAGYYVPNAKNIQSVSVATNGGSSDYGYYNYVYSHEKDIISLITEEHKHITDEMEKWESNEGGFNVHYNLNNGKQVYRSYDAAFVSDDFWNRVFTSEGYRVSEINDLNYDRTLNNGFYKELTTIRLINRHSGKNYLEFSLSDIDQDELLAALEKDLRADNEYGRRSDFSVGILQIGKYDESYNTGTLQYDKYFSSYYNFTIYEDYTNTISLLQRHGTVPTRDESLADSTVNGKVYTLTRTKINRVDDSFIDLMWGGACEAVFITEEEFKEITQHEAVYNNVPDDGYVYTVSRGLSHMIGSSYDENPGYDYKQMLNDIGMYYDNYEFLDDIDYLYNSGYSRSYYINEEYNSRCAEIFEGRVSFDKFYYQMNGQGGNYAE